MAAKSYFEPKVVGDYEFDEVASALQKMIRRGKEYEACYWAYILHVSGYGLYIWRRLSIITCEDIGNGTPLAPVVINSLNQMWVTLHKHDKEPSLDKFLLVVQAVIYLCRSQKSRENDSLSNLIEEHFKSDNKLEIPEVAIDSHTQRGKQIYGKFSDEKDGKGKLRLDRWFGINAKITNQAYEDKWEQQLKEIWYGRSK